MRRLFKVIIGLIIVVVVVVVVFVVGANIYTITSTRDDVHTVAQLENNHADAIVVLGASVYIDGTPSDILADRLAVAADLYKAGAADVIIMSGDGHESHYDEPDAMKAYCVDLGVPADDIYIDDAGYNTYASIYRAQNTYGAQDIIVVTQAYHLYRALAVAQGLGMEAVGVASDKGEYENQFFYSLREVVARSKDLIETFFRMVPEDNDIPITL